jgi:hypothetical protein
MPVTLSNFTLAKLQPSKNPQDTRANAGYFGPSLTIPLGQVLGRKTSDKRLYPRVVPNNVQTIKIAGALSAGVIRVTAINKDGNPVSNTVAYNANAGAWTTALNAILGAGAVSVAIPTDYATGIVVTFSGADYAAKKQPIVDVDASGATGATTATVEDSTVYTGIETACALNILSIKTDANSKCYHSDSAVPSEINIPLNSSQVFEHGTFRETDLVGFDDNVLKELGARRDGLGNVVIPS